MQFYVGICSFPSPAKHIKCITEVSTLWHSHLILIQVPYFWLAQRAPETPIPITSQWRSQISHAIIIYLSKFTCLRHSSWNALLTNWANLVAVLTVSSSFITSVRAIWSQAQISNQLRLQSSPYTLMTRAMLCHAAQVTSGAGILHSLVLSQL